MAAPSEKTIREFSIPSSSNVPTGPAVNAGENFELKPGVIHMVQATPFCGLATEDSNNHLQQFLEICSTFTMKAWDACSNAFLAKYFPLGKTNALRNKISSFQQLADETVAEAWARLQEYIAACPHHGMEEWLTIQSFFHGLNRTAQEHLDAAAGGSFLSQSVRAAKNLIDKIATNQGWKENRSHPRSRGVHHIDSTDMLAAKMDLLLKKLEDNPETAPVQALDTRMTCEVCGNTGHSGSSCPETRLEDTNFIGHSSNFNNGNRPQPGWNTRPYLPFSRQGKEQEKTTETEENDDLETSTGAAKEKAPPKTIPHKFYDSTVLLFPQRNKKAATDEQYSKNYMSIYLARCYAVPTYAKYLKDILNNKKPPPLAEIVHMTEECSAAILNQPPQKKDPDSPTIPCSIGNQVFNQALCDLGASVSVMPKIVFDKLNHAALVPTSMCLQLVNQSIQHPAGIAEYVPVKIRNFLIPVDFVVLDIEIDAKTLLILGRPFLSTAEASIDVGAGEVHLNINGMRETFSFKPKVEQCSQVKIFKCQKYVPKPPIYDAFGKEMDSIVAFMKRKLATEATIRQ
ncbi:hypothetical protein U9M48_008983 [Paspalum notatum var. saurae]|uniref:Retrotransposon gag domain-containing protein n=1 Tax=Paspalum notatum var. saurae TaxID=547442 RepID=A0AAQ3SQ42_PASNO